MLDNSILEKLAKTAESKLNEEQETTKIQKALKAISVASSALDERRRLSNAAIQEPYTV